jgi:hypothetical protein
MSREPNHEHASEPRSAARKPYGGLQLIVYGDVQSLTRAVGLAKNNDGGTPPNNKSG